MNIGQKSNQENKMVDLYSHMLLGIFHIVVFICGTFLVSMILCFSKDIVSDAVIYVALFMWLEPALYYLYLFVRLCINKKHITNNTTS